MSKPASLLRMANELADLVGVERATNSTDCATHSTLVFTAASECIRNYRLLADRQQWQPFGVCAG